MQSTGPGATGSESGREHPEDGSAGPHLPTDRPRATARGYAAETETTVLDARTVARLDAVSTAAGVPLLVTVLTAWAAVLHRHTAQPDLLLGLDAASFAEVEAADTGTAAGGAEAAGVVGDVGVVGDGGATGSAGVAGVAGAAGSAGAAGVAGAAGSAGAAGVAGAAGSAGAAGVAGAAVRTAGASGTGAGPVPLRIRMRPTAPFSDELARFRGAVADALGAWPAAGSPPRPLHREQPAAVIGRAPAASLRDAEPDVALTVERAPTGTVLALRYDASLFARATAAWLLGHCARLLAEAAAAPDTPVRDLRVQDEPAASPWRLPVPDGYRAPEPARPGETLVDRFRRTAAAHPDRPAVTGPQGTVSYAELDRISDAAARRLRRFAGPGKRLALLCAHDVGAVAAVWAVLKTGAGYVPLDPRQPNGRLTRLVADADVSAVVCDPDLRSRASTLSRGARVITLDPGVPPAPADAPSDTPPGGTGDTRQGPEDGDALAYLLHTSGSTGRPKAVAQTHANVLAHTLGYAARLRLGPGDQVPLLARYTFDAAVMDLYGALLTGATLHVLDPMAPAPTVRVALRTVGATVLHATPTLFRHLVGDLPEGVGPEPSLASVRAVVLGGEEATRHDLRSFLTACPPGSSLVNGLGPTECTLATQHLAGRADLGGLALPVGHPVDGVRVRLVDEDGHPTELLGELEIHSDLVAQGYWRQPEATAAAFSTDADGTRRYRTGDLARRRADGALVFVGRKDRQVKIRGHRIEPAEIEVALRGHPTVAEAALTVDSRAAAPRLVGYVTPATAFPPDTVELQRYLARNLPDYAVPWRVVALDRLPLGPTGKVDRTRLPAPEENEPDATAAPTTPLERATAGIWCRVLGIDSADLHSTFLASGGDSIRMLTMLTAVKDELGAEVPLMEFLAAPTIATLVKLIEREAPC